MKNNTKNIAKVVVALVAAVLMFFSSLSSVVSAANREVKKVVNVIMENIEVPATNILEKTVPTGCYAAAIPTINIATILVDKITETTNTVSQKVNTTFIYKPETHYIHTKDCYWVKTGETKKITNTEDINARICDECCPDIEITNLYTESTVEATEEEEYYEESTYENETQDELPEVSYESNYSVSDWEYTLLCRIVSSEYGSDWVPIEEKAKIVASVMAMVYNPNYPNSIEGVLDVACAPWGFNKYGDYYMSDSIYAAVDYYFTSGAFSNWTYTSWSGDGTWNYFY